LKRLEKQEIVCRAIGLYAQDANWQRICLTLRWGVFASTQKDGRSPDGF